MVSCKDKGAEAWSQEQADKQAAATAAAEAAAAAQAAEFAKQKELLEYMIFSVGKLAGEQTSNPVWYEQVRDMRNKLEEYYNSLEESGKDPQLSMRLGLMLADITRTMKAFDKALKLYGDVLSKWEKLPEADRQSLEGRRMRSSIANGMGGCYLVQRGKATEALPYYEKALEIDKAIYQELAPEGNGELPPGNAPIDPNLERAAEDVLSSYRCLGDCQRWAEDPEEARDTYKEGQTLARRMNHLRPGASLQYIRLLSAMGDLENSCGQLQNAAAAWGYALQLSQNLEKLSLPTALLAKVKQDQTKLANSLKAILPKVRAEQEANRAAEAEDTPIPTDATVAPPAAE